MSSLCAIFHLCMGEILAFFIIVFVLACWGVCLFNTFRQGRKLHAFCIFFLESFVFFVFVFVQMKLLLQHQRLNHPFPIKGSYFFIDLKYTVV